MEEMWDQKFGQEGWNLRFLRDFNDWELDMVGELALCFEGSQALFGGRLGFLEGRKKWTV